MNIISHHAYPPARKEESALAYRYFGVNTPNSLPMSARARRQYCAHGFLVREAFNIATSATLEGRCRLNDISTAAAGIAADLPRAKRYFQYSAAIVITMQYGRH